MPGGYHPAQTRFGGDRNAHSPEALPYDDHHGTKIGDVAIGEILEAEKDGPLERDVRSSFQNDETESNAVHATPELTKHAFELEFETLGYDDDSQSDGETQRADESANLVFATEVLQTECNWFCKLIVKRPVFVAALSMLLPILCSVIALTGYTFSIDVSLDSFRIRDHHTSILEDAVKVAGVESETAWAAYDAWLANQNNEDVERVDLVAGPPRLTGLRDSDELMEYNTTCTNSSDHDTTWTNTSGRRKLTQASSASQKKRSRVRWQVHVIYVGVPVGVNVLTASHLNQARRLENDLMRTPKYSKFCWQGLTGSDSYFNGCQPPNSIVPFFFDRINDGGTEGERTFHNVLQVSSRIAGDGAYAYVDKSFDSETGTAAGLRSDFLFSAPVPGFTSPDTDKPAQASVYRGWVGAEIFPVLKKQASLAKKVDDQIDVIFGGEELTEFEILLELRNEVAFVGIGIAAVLVYMTVHMDYSLFLTASGLFEIFVSFPASYFFYRVVMNVPFVSVLQFLSIFVILGIGVDDVFVFYDTYDAATKAVGRDLESLTQRLSYAYKHAVRFAFSFFTSA